MNLPELPKKYNRTESKVDGLVALALIKKHPHKNWALEVKMKGGKKLSHQTNALKQVEDGVFPPYKLADMGRRMPFDYIHIGDADAIYCVVDDRNVECEVNSGVIKYKFKI